MAALWGMLALLFLGGCGGRVFYLPDPGAGAAWRQAGGGPEGRASCAAAPLPPLRLLWQQHLSAAPLGGPMVEGDLLLQVTTGPTLLAFDRGNGRQLGRRGLSAAQSAAGVLLGSRLVVGEAGPKPALRAYERTGKGVRWSHAGLARAPLCARGDTVVAALNGGQVLALAGSTGKVLWQAQLQAPLWATPVLSGASAVLGEAGGRLVALDLGTGAQRWVAEVGGAVRSLALDDSVVYAATASGRIAAFRLADATPLWSVEIGALPTAGLALSGQKLVFGTADRRVCALDGRTGDLLWHFATEGVVSSAPAAATSVVYVGGSEGFLYALDLADGHLVWKYQLDGPALQPLSLAPDLVAVTTEEKTLYVFGP